MCSASASSSNPTLDSVKLVKFVELLVHDYLQAKGFTATGAKFSEECLKSARDRDAESSNKNRHVGSGGSADSTASNDGSAVDEASSWYYLADKLALPELLRHNAMAPVGQRFNAVMEVLVNELPLQGKMGVSRSALGIQVEGGREPPRKHHATTARRGHGHSSPPKGNRASNAGGVLNKFHFSKDAIRRQQMSHESWIPDDLRMKMMRRSMAVIKENVYESVAQDSLVRKEKKRSSRSELEIVKTQEKFGTKHQRPCALCEQSFSEVNLVLAVPFKAIVDLRIAWQKTLPQAKGTTTKTNRTMLMPPQCYNEVKVCAFCSQLFHDPLGYRPTWDMELQSMRKQREQLAREKEREYWDPLRKATQTKDQEPYLLTTEPNQTAASPAPIPEA
eukprot:g9461.t1